MADLSAVILIATPDYGVWYARCPQCRGAWEETTSALYNVVSLPCPYCTEMLAVEDGDFHGDDNARDAAVAP